MEGTTSSLTIEWWWSGLIAYAWFSNSDLRLGMEWTMTELLTYMRLCTSPSCDEWTSTDRWTDGICFSCSIVDTVFSLRAWMEEGWMVKKSILTAPFLASWESGKEGNPMNHENWEMDPWKLKSDVSLVFSVVHARLVWMGLLNGFLSKRHLSNHLAPFCRRLILATAALWSASDNCLFLLAISSKLSIPFLIATFNPQYRIELVRISTSKLCVEE